MRSLAISTTVIRKTALHSSLGNLAIVCIPIFIAMIAGALAASQPLMSLVLSLAFVGSVLVYGLISWFKSPVIPILLLCGFGALPGVVRTPFISLSALITLSIVGLLLVSFLSVQGKIEPVDWLWSLFLFWAVFVTLTTRGLSQVAIQNLSVYTSFFLVMLLTRIHFSNGILTYQALHRAMIGFAILTPVVYWVPWEFWRLGSTRGFALAALVPICWFASRWRRAFSLEGAIVVAMSLILLSTLSRTALATALLIVVISRVDVHSIMSLLRVVVSGLVVAAIAVYMVTRIESLNSRFFTGDLSLSVGGVPINATGRTNLWEITSESINKSEWTRWIGQGAGSASSLIEEMRPGLGHPHNDFLRVWHDFGLVGLVLWSSVWFSLIVVIVKRWRQSESSNAWVYRPGLLAALAMIPPMFTDNVIVYYFAMLPSAVLIGVAQSHPISECLAESPTDSDSRNVSKLTASIESGSHANLTGA